MAVVTDTKTPLGKFILQQLYQMGKNQAWLGEQIGVKPNHVCILCSKTKSPKIETLFKISKALDVNLDELHKVVSENMDYSEEQQNE